MIIEQELYKLIEDWKASEAELEDWGFTDFELGRRQQLEACVDQLLQVMMISEFYEEN